MSEAKGRWDGLVGKGWHKLLDDLDRKLTRVGLKYEVAQIKEKFGGLRFYVAFVEEQDDTLYDVGWDLIHHHEARSFHICEDCGKWGRVRPGGWVRTLCDECHGKRAK